MEVCRICKERRASELAVVRPPLRPYLRCASCESIFVKVEDHVSPKQELSVYRLHENSAHDERYRSYLSPVIEMAWKEIQQKAESRTLSMLDFGSGPIPINEESVICRFFREKGMLADAYDPYFRPKVLGVRSYDLIIACEVVEHFRNPYQDFKRLTGLLKKEGVLVIQTEMLSSPELFDNWYYRRDPTHVAFYSRKSFSVLAKNFDLDYSFAEDGKRLIMTRVHESFFNLAESVEA